NLRGPKYQIVKEGVLGWDEDETFKTNVQRFHLTPTQAKKVPCQVIKEPRKAEARSTLKDSQNIVKARLEHWTSVETSEDDSEITTMDSLKKLKEDIHLHTDGCLPEWADSDESPNYASILTQVSKVANSRIRRAMLRVSAGQ
ncbi:hypothetical protein M8C21_022352, partial [Ambrosia artemisiifolia]